MRNLRFTSFEEMIETLIRGNEVVFSYKNEQYYLLPNWVDNVVCGFHIGPVYRAGTICTTAKELASFNLGGVRLIDAFGELEIIERTI